MKLFHRASARPQVPGRPTRSAVELLTQQIGRVLFERAQAAPAPGVLSDMLVHQAMADPAFKAQLFRFVDVFPMLKTPTAIQSHLQEYLTQPGVKPPASLAVALAAGSYLKAALAGTVTHQVNAMARGFIAGATPEEALGVLRRLWMAGTAFSVDLLGEACLSEEEAAAYQRRYLGLLDYLPKQVAAWPVNPVLDANHVGPLPRVNVSIKISSLHGHIRPEAFARSLAQLTEAVAPILARAREVGAFVNFDMEQHALKDLTLALFMQCAERMDFAAGIAVQAYLRSVDEDLQTLMEFSRRTGRQFTVRLIKGAYWDYELIHARQENWPSPVWAAKAQTDAAFERATAALVEQIPRDRWQGGIHLAVGSHNLRSIAHALACVRQAGLPDAALEIQMLYGMAEQLQAAVTGAGLRLRQYAPIGQMIPGMAYLVRRLLENTSNESWLRQASLNEASSDQLLAPPEDQAPPEPQQAPHETAGVKTAPAAPAAFLNEPHRDFASFAQREAFAQALAGTVLPDAPVEVPVDAALAALDAARAAFPAWRDTAPEQRAAVLRHAADLMSARRDALAALVLQETHKPWAEADADVCEAIDFCRYYAATALPLLTPRVLSDVPGEIDQLVHVPRGPALVIAPWNFPLAILTGMTTAALVTGNPVLMKPAEQSSRIAARLCEILYEAGMPREALHFVPGAGETVGAALVRDPRLAIIAFTGSKAVGLDILQAAAQVAPGQDHLKRVIVEMGGKNAIIVDASADLDDAVLGVRQSAFSYAGQKCSACSRCIVLEEVYETFVRRLVESTKALIVGDAGDPATDVPPVIDDEAARKIWHYIGLGRQQATLAHPIGLRPSEIGHRLIPPHIFTDVPPHSPLGAEEIFGPVLSIFRVSSFEAALELANASSYKLTGGVYSRTPSHLEAARQRFHVGNLYLNRAITGALVGRQPFGGFGLSGLGSKAGGPDYLLHFLDPKTLTENTLRHGFAPVEASPAAPVTGE